MSADGEGIHFTAIREIRILKELRSEYLLGVRCESDAKLPIECENDGLGNGNASSTFRSVIALNR